MSGFFEEVKRRKVYRVAVAYVVAAGAMIQLASAAFPAWELPTWALRLVIVLLLIGFPIALIFAWIFDITPEGIARTSRTEPQTMPKSHRRRNMWIVAATGAVVAALAGFFLLPGASARKVDKSIAILPFESFSDERDSAFFADGIQDDILTNLAKIGDLKVISRTSVAGYRGKPASVREIGKTLGVSYLLEGTVRKDKNRVRVNVQLINAQSDQHLWAEDYNRDLNDIFAIQTDLAQKIASELQAKLSPSEKVQMTRKPTENGEAYLAFIQARNVFVPEDVEKLKQSEQLVERALELDPNFAAAAAFASHLESWMYRNFDRTPPRIAKARNFARRAIELQPDLPEAHLAVGYCNYYGDQNYDAAAHEFEIARRGLPNDTEVLLAVGAIQRRQGRWADSTANLERAAALSPKETWPMQNLALNYEMLRDYKKANETVDNALQIAPHNFGLWEIKIKLAFEEKGDLSVAENALAHLDNRPLPPELEPQIAMARCNVALLQRQYANAIRVAETVPDDAKLPHTDTDKYALIGMAKIALHDEAGAREAFLKAKGRVEKDLEQSPDDPVRLALYSQILASLGERDAALAQLGHATKLLPQKDAFEGPQLTELVAQTYAILGDVQNAVAILDSLLARPAAITVATLKVNLIWDPIRADPRFKGLLDKYSAKT